MTYYQEHKEDIKRRYREKRIKEGKTVDVYRKRNGYILSNENETLYFQTIKSIAEYFNMDKNLVYYRMFKAKRKKTICGYEVDEAL